MMIQMFHVTKVHPSGTKALADAYFSAPAGSFTVLLGETRAGKSTFLKILCGEEAPTSGTVWVDHQEIHKMDRPEKKRWLAEVGLILPDLRLFPEKTVEQNILLPLQVKGAVLDGGSASLPILLEKVGLKDKGGAKPADLSSGEQQTVKVLRAMVFRPRLLLADEPFQGLEERTVGVLSRFLDQLHKEGTTILLSAQQSPALARMREAFTETPVDWMKLQDGKLAALEALE